MVPSLGSKSKYAEPSVHRILRFRQSNWLKKYIDFNTDKRKNAANSFKKDFFKLMNNSVFDKTVEKIRKRINVELTNNVRDMSNA